ncbi:hypothetical protein ACWGKS_22300 [Nocardiopsis sp. NPDC055879]
MTSTRRQRTPMRVLLLSVLVLGHFLCSVCHAAVATADTTTEVGSAPAAVQTTGATASSVALHGLDEDGRSVCATEGDVSVDLRLTAAEMLILLIFGMVVVAALWLAPPRPGPWLTRRPLITTRSGPPLLLSLCIQRV